MNAARSEGVRRAARLCAVLTLALAVTGCSGREPAPSATPVAATATPAPTDTPDTGTTLESSLGTTFESPPGTTLESPLATPAPDRAMAEAEIAAFMLNRIVAQEIGGLAAGARDALIVWAPVEPGGEGETAFDRLPKFDEENPIRVWAYGAGEAVEVGGDAAARAEAIREYRRNTIEADATDDIITWGLYEFGILALDEAAGQATVYRDASCGRLCGSGVIYTLVRGPDGAWSVVDASSLWIA